MPRATINRLGYQPSLDGVRALAIGAVVGLHLIVRFFQGGYLGVDIFFVLSACLITSLTLEETTDRGGGYGFRAFYARRARRLGPALVVWLVVLAPPAAVALGETGHVLSSTLAALLYVGDFAVAGIVPLHVSLSYAHIWSLAIEEQFYLVWPVLLVFVVARQTPVRRRRLLVGFALLAPVFHLVSGVLTSTTSVLPSGHLAPIAAGCLAAELFVFGVPARVMQVVTRPSVPWAALAGLGAFVLGYRPHGIGFDVLVTTTVAVITGVLVLHLCLGPRASPAVDFLASRPMVWIGKRSYGLYLYHRAIAYLLVEAIPGLTLHFAGPLTVVCSLAFAGLSYRLVERPVIAAGRRPAPRYEATVDEAEPAAG